MVPLRSLETLPSDTGEVHAGWQGGEEDSGTVELSQMATLLFRVGIKITDILVL